MKTTRLLHCCAAWGGELRRLFLVGLFAMLTLSAAAQGNAIKGKVVDTSGLPVIGANVVVLGTTNGANSDIDGNFALNNVTPNAKIEVSFVGYKTVEFVAVPSQTFFNVTLEEDSATLDEVVVVGYGVVKKSDVTGALTRVTSADIEERPVQNALQAMQGKAAGVVITTNSRPGELGDVRIRGNRSINASNDPLYVVDGIPLADKSSMGDINPNDIESMEVLKDASATAIYGSRGANGVVLITTKRGTKGKTSVSYNGSFSFSRINSMTDWMNAGEYIDWRMQSMINANNYPGEYGTAPDPTVIANIFDLNNAPEARANYERAWTRNGDGTFAMRAATPEEIAKGYAAQVPIYNPDAIETTDWMKAVTRTGFTQNHQVSMTAGTEISNIYVSFAYLNQKAGLVDQDYKRYTANVNGELTPVKWMTVGMGINASHSVQNYGAINTGSGSNSGSKDIYSAATSMMPFYPAYDDNGDPIKWTLQPNNIKDDPVWNIGKGINETRVYSAMLSSHIDLDFGKMWQPLEGLKWRTNFGAQFRNNHAGQFYGPDYHSLYGSGDWPSTAYNNQSTRISWTLENMIFYNRTFGDHTLGLTLVQAAEQYQSDGMSYRAREVTFPTSLWYGLSSSDTSQNGIGSSYSKQTRASYMARVNYNFKDRYLLTVTGRWDGASVLAVGNKWDFFPSAALAWKINEESFLRDVRWMDQLKLRVGYGVTGNAAVSPYQTSGTMTDHAAGKFFGVGAVSTATKGAKANVLPNAELGWEKTASTNVGLDFGFFGNRINGSIEYYEARTRDLILDRAIPVITGYTTIRSNIGKTANRGFELTLSTVNVKTQDFTWSTDFSLATNKGWIVELASGAEDDTANGWFINRPIDNIWNYKYDRLWQNTDADLRMMAIYKANGISMMPGQAMIVDQAFNERPGGGEGTKSVDITWVDTNGVEHTETVSYEENGFGVINDDDKKHIGQWSPKVTGGITTNFSYKNWELSAFFYLRFSNTYFGTLQTLGRRVEKDVWSPENPNGQFPVNASGGIYTGTTSYANYMNYSSGSMVALRNISLSYTLPDRWLRKAGISKCQIYGQILNPFIWGNMTNYGINPDDITGWSTMNSQGVLTGGQTNNTMLTRHYVLGLRLSF